MPRRVTRIAQLRGWLPASVDLDPVEPVVSWINAGSARLDEPFFHQSLERAKAIDPDLEEAITGLDALARCEKAFDSLKPTAFIFHVSRCGSTLVSNGLRALEGAVVISEAQPVSALLWPYSPEVWPYSREQWQSRRGALIAGAINALGQRREARDRYYFIKFTSWNVLALRFIESLWPAVPVVFVYRNPVEVIVSNLQKNSGWMQMKSSPETAAQLLGWEADEVARMSAEEYCARVIARFCDTAAELASANTVLLNYEDIHIATLVSLAKSFGINPNDAEVARMEQSLRVYSKEPGRAKPFLSDAELKRKAASALANEAAERWAAPAYARLNSLAAKLP